MYRFIGTLFGIFIVGIIVGHLFSDIIFINWKQYRKYWKPIYDTRKEQFDDYLKYALEHREENESLESIANYAAYLNYDAKVEELNIDKQFGKDNYIDTKKEMYISDLRGAGIE